MVKPFVSRIAADEQPPWPMIEPSQLPASSRVKTGAGLYVVAHNKKISDRASAVSCVVCSALAQSRQRKSRK